MQYVKSVKNNKCIPVSATFRRRGVDGTGLNVS
jgi:hypothetical protein